MIIGYDVAPQNDNDSYMFSVHDPNVAKCPKCGYVTDYGYISPLFKLNRRNWDMSSTYDNRDIVSLKFKEFCIRNNYKGVEFKKLPNDPNFFKLEIKNIIKYDAQKANLKYDKYCDRCHNYKSVTPAYPIFLKQSQKELNDGFYVTDVHFASGNEKAPLIIIGPETYEKMKKEKFKGIIYTKIVSHNGSV